MVRIFVQRCLFFMSGSAYITRLLAGLCLCCRCALGYISRAGDGVVALAIRVFRVCGWWVACVRALGLRAALVVVARKLVAGLVTPTAVA